MPDLELLAPFYPLQFLSFDDGCGRQGLKQAVLGSPVFKALAGKESLRVQGAGLATCWKPGCGSDPSAPASVSMLPGL